MFQELFPGRFGELGEKAARLLTLAARATGYKLIPKKDAYTESLPELWFDIAGICDQVFRYIIREDMGFTFTSYVNFQQICHRLHESLRPNTIETPQPRQFQVQPTATRVPQTRDFENRFARKIHPYPSYPYFP